MNAFFSNLNQVSERTSFVRLKNALRRGDIGQTSKQGRLNSRHGHRREEARKRIFYTTSLLSVRRPTIPDFSSLSCTAYGSLFVFFINVQYSSNAKWAFRKRELCSTLYPSYIQLTYLRKRALLKSN